MKKKNHDILSLTLGCLFLKIFQQ